MGLAQEGGTMAEIFHRVRAIIGTVVLLTSVVFVVQATTGAGVASARCAGVNNPTTSTLAPNGIIYVSETPATGTCNNNNIYAATFRSHFDGWRASVWIQNGGIWTPYFGGYNTVSVNYRYTDDNSHSYMSLCLDNFAQNGATGTYVYCGWGGTYDFRTDAYFDVTYAYGVNYGF
jgi:hypothetical protein